MHPNHLILTAELHRKHAALGNFMAGPNGQHLFILAVVALVAILLITGISKVLGGSSRPRTDT